MIIVAQHGAPELTEDPEEAYEVAHGTKDLEDKYSRELGRLGVYYETGVAMLGGDYSPETDRGKKEQNDVAMDVYDDTQRLRIKADKLGDAYSAVYKNEKGAA